MGGRSINFRAGVSDMTAATVDIVEQVSAVLKAYPSLTICIEGHTACEPKHAAGRKCNLQPLSTARVEAVKALMRQQGVACNLVVRGWGCHHPDIKVEHDCKRASVFY